MRAVIVGCGRVGASIAESLDAAGHQVVIIDIATSAFDRLPASFGGEAIRGDGTDEDQLRRAGAEGADLLLALTEGDNRNVMAAQIAREALGIDERRREDQRPGACACLRGARRRDDVPHHAPGRRRHGVPGPDGLRRPRDPPASASSTPDPFHQRGAAVPSQRPARRADRVRHRRRRAGRSATTSRRSSSRPATRSCSWRRPASAPSRSPTRSARSSSRATGARGTSLAEAGANRADIVAAVTGDDEDNLVICQMAKHHFSVKRTIARVNNPKNEPLFRHLGVDEIISPTRMILGSIEQDIPVHELLHLADLGGGDLELIEALLTDESPAIGTATPRDLADARRLHALRVHPRATRRSPSAPTRSSATATRSSSSGAATARTRSTARSSGDGRRPGAA